MHFGDAGTLLESPTRNPSYRYAPAISDGNAFGEEDLAMEVGSDGRPVVLLIAYGDTEPVGAHFVEAHMECHKHHAFTGLDEMGKGLTVLSKADECRYQKKRDDKQALHNENRWADTTMSTVSTCLYNLLDNKKFLLHAESFESGLGSLIVGSDLKDLLEVGDGGSLVVIQIVVGAEITIGLDETLVVAAVASC